MRSRRRPHTATSAALDRRDQRADETLLERLRDRDPHAIGDAYTQHGTLVFATAVRLLGDHQLAEECTQDVFMALWHNAATIDPARARVTTWLYAVTRNRAVELDRRRRARPATPVADVPVSALEPDPAELAERDDEARRVMDALAQLPDDQRQVLTLAYYGGFSQGEISKRLGLPLGTVKSRARLALDRMRATLAPQSNDSGVPRE